MLPPLCVFSQDVAKQHYKIYNTATQKTISVNDIVNDMAKADVLFFGEEHNDSIGHVVELDLFKALIEKYPGKAALSMEMFETDCQPVLNEYLKGLIREKNFLTDARAWPNYKDYRPLIELAKSSGVNIIAANAPTRYINMVTRLGLNSLTLLDAWAKSYLPPLPIDTATGSYYNKFAAIMGGHASMDGMQLYQSQSLWDATMGWQIAQYLRKYPDAKVLQLNGSFHSEEKLGAVAQLKRYNPKANVLNIASISGRDMNNPDWAAIATLADYVVLTDTK